MTVGDPIPLQLQFVAPAGYQAGPLHFALPGDTLVETGKPTVSTRDDSLWTVSTEVALFAPGRFAVTPQSLTLFGSEGDSLQVAFPPESVTVASVLPANVDSVKPADYKPIIAPPARIPWWAWTLAVLVVAGIAALIWYRRRPRLSAPKPAAPRRPPWELALERLGALEAQQHHRRGEARPFAIALSEIVREYLEGRYGFEALEQTTTEIKAALPHVDITEDQRRTLIETLTGCDLAKYAKFDWPAPELERSLALAHKFVSDTIPRPEPEVSRL